MGIRLSQIRMRQVFNLFDSNGDGSVDFVEFSERLFPDWQIERGSEETSATFLRKASSVFTFRRRSSASLETKQPSSNAEPGTVPPAKTSSETSAARWVSVGPGSDGAGVEGGTSCSSDEAGAQSVEADEHFKSLQESAHKAAEELHRVRAAHDAAAVQAAGNAARLATLEEKMAGLLATSGQMEKHLALLCEHFQLSVSQTEV